MSHDSFDRGGMELDPDRKLESSAYHPRIGAPTQILKIGFAHQNGFVHHFENPYGYQNVQKKIHDRFCSYHVMELLAHKNKRLSIKQAIEELLNKRLVEIQ